MKSAVALLTLLLFSGALAHGQDHPTITAPPNSIFVGAEGKFEANPDTALVQFNISAQDNNSRAAYDRASKQSEQVRGILRSNGIETLVLAGLATSACPSGSSAISRRRSGTRP